MIVECFVTTLYTAAGGFRVSFITDNVQGAMVICLIIIGVITVGVQSHVDRSLIDSSRYLDSSLLGWQLVYILPVAILTNDFFLSGFWMRTFAAKTDKDLWVGISLAVFAITCILGLVGAGGLIAGWSGVLGSPPQPTGIELFQLFETLPAWVVGIILVMVVSLSTAAFDSLQSSIISTGSNDLFRNRLNIWWIRLIIVIVFVPTVVIALKSPSVLQVYLISDLISASSIPVLVIGLSSKCYWWRGFEVVVGGLGGIFTIFLFGLVYYDGDALQAGRLLILEDGLYGDDWSAFGAFVAAPVGGLLWAFAAFGLRISVQWILAKRSGRRFDAFDRPAAPDASFYTGRVDDVNGGSEGSIHRDGDGVERSVVDVKGRFF